MNEICRMSVGEIVETLKKRGISCVEVMKAHLDRIEEVNPRVNAVTRVLEKEALARAGESDRALSSGEAVGPLHGVPFTVKENIDLAGWPTTFGVSVLAGAVPERDAPHIKNLKEAGAIPIARTNLPELGLRPHTFSQISGHTLNPWDRRLSPGGSSGGDAVAVATGMTPLGVGNDYGGSLRCPAQFCGIAAIRPTLGRVPDHMSLLPAEPAITSQLFLAQGPLARSAADLELVFPSMCRRDPRDPWFTPAPLTGPELAGPLKIAVIKDFTGVDCDPAVANGIVQAAGRLARSGYEIEEVSPPSLERAWELWLMLTGAELRLNTIPHVKGFSSPQVLKFLDYWVEIFPGLDLGGYMNGLAERNDIARQWVGFQEEYPLILGPVLSRQPFELDHDISGLDEFRALIESYRLTMSVNLLGLPAVVVPVGLENGLPRAVQIVGPRYREDLCFRAAAVLEEHFGGLTPLDPR